MKQEINILLKKRKSNDLKNLNDSKASIEFSNNIQDVYQNIAECNTSRKCNVLIIFDTSTVFITQPYFQISKNVRLIMKINQATIHDN